MSGISTMLGHLLALQRINIWQPYLYSLFFLYLHLIAQYLNFLCFNAITLYFMACNASVVDFGNNAFNILNAIRLPSAPESILHVMYAPLWLVLDSNLVNITHFLLSKLRYFIVTKSKFLSFGLVASAVAWHLDWPHGLTSCLLVVSGPSAVSVLIYTLPWSGWDFCIFCMQGIVSADALSHNICSCPFFSVSYWPHCHVLVCCVP